MNSPCAPRFAPARSRRIDWAKALCALSAAALAPAAFAHGGTYVGPASGPTSGGQTTAGAPTLSGPGPATGATFPGKGPVTDAANFAAWEDWWHFNQDPYLDLKRAIGSDMPATLADEIVTGRPRGSRPFLGGARARITPALRAILEEERSNEVVGSALIALARSREPSAGDGGRSLAALLARHLADNNQETVETAALSLGILRSAESLTHLEALLSRSPRGKELVGGREPNDRTRAFAAYGLGLSAAHAENNRARQLIARILCAALVEPRPASPDVEVAAVIALSLDRLDPDRSVGAPASRDRSTIPWVSRETQVRFLQQIFADGRRRPFVRAHAATALARLADDAPDELRAEVAEALLAAVRPRSKVENEVLQSATQALGLIGDGDGDALDRKIRSALILVVDDADAQARSFALMALARIGAREGSGEHDENGANACRNALLGELVRGRSATRPWAAMALGVMERRILDARSAPKNQAERPEKQAMPAGGTAGGIASSDPVRAELRAYLGDARVRTHIGAGSIALGLCRDPKAGPILLEKLKHTSEDQGQGYVALALGMIGEERAVKPLKELVRTSKYKPALLESAAVALALLGERTAAAEIANLLAKAHGQSSQASLARALGRIGDERAVEPLLRMIEGKELTSAARAFAAAALGMVADEDFLPWYSPISLDLNYRANPATLLAGDGSGVLEIL